MADTARAKVSFTPVVTIAADSDADSVDAIHHDIKQTLGGKLEYSFSQQAATARWYYSSATSVTATSANLCGGFSSPSTFTDGTAINQADDVRMVYIEHLGLNSSGVASSSTDYLYVTLDGGDAGSEPDAICLEPNESIVLKFKLASGVTMGTLDADAPNTAKVKIVAIVDDGA
tara:strand:+ start:876 stop:1397 length:522 start_codon:yes stop_codon:yes gene_type:complete